MARGREKAVVDVVINNEEARKKIAELETALKDFEKQKRAALKEKNTDLYDRLDKEYKAASSQLRQYRKEVVDVENVLQNLNKVPLSQLQQAHRKLRSELKTLNQDSEEYLVTMHKIQRLEAQMDTAKPRSSGGMNNRLVGMLGGTALIAAMKRMSSQAVEAYQKIDDKMADVIKTTGLTKEEVIALDKVLQQIDTRTTREDLLDLARVAGKLGIEGSDNIAGFVRAADQIRVALTEDLGGNVEESIRKVGKLTDIFNLKEDLGIEKAFLAVGSAINSLGASSTANEEYLIEFTNRVAGIAPGMDISIQKVLGLGATLDQLGQSSEVSATAYGQVMMKMRKNTEDFARIAGMELRDFSQLMEKDANEAFIKFLDGLGSAAMTDRVKMLDSLKLSGQRTSQVLGVLADNTGMLREQQALANEEFAKATSLTEEYNTKNESAAAIVEKRRKVMDQALADLGEKLFPLWSEALGLTGNLFQALTAVLGVGVKYGGVILSLTAAVAAYNVVKKLQVFWGKANRAAMLEELATMKGATAGTKLLSAAKLLLAGNLRAAGMAFKMFFASIGPIGWIVTALSAVASVISIVRANTTAAAKAVKDLVDINKRANDTYVEEKTRLEELLRVAGDKNVSDEKRRRAIKDLQEAMPNGIDLINEETIATGEAKKAVDKYCESLLLRAKLEAGFEKLKELEKERLNDLEEGKDKALNWWQQLQYGVLSSMGLLETAMSVAANKVVSNIEKSEQEYLARQERIKKQLKQWQSEVNGIFSSGSPGDNGGPEPSGWDDPDKKKWKLENDKKYLTGKIELRKKFLNDEIATEEEYNRMLLDLEIETLEARINLNKEKGADLLRLQAELEDKKYQQKKSEQAREDKLKAASLEGGEKNNVEQQLAAARYAHEKQLKDLGLFGKRREAMTESELSALENLERNHRYKMQKIQMDDLHRKFTKEKEALDATLNQLKIAHNEELAQADTFAKKKALLSQWLSADELRTIHTDRQADRRLKEEYQRIEQEQAKEHLQKMLVYYTSYMAEVKACIADGLSVLNDDEIQRLQTIIDELQKKLAEIRGTVATEGEDKGDKVDILGFSPDDWERFFGNLDDGTLRLKDWQMALNVVGEAFGSISKLMSAAEQREFKQYERTAKEKKKVLDNQLKQGLISQNTYNEKVQNIDKETDRRKEELERKQAIREKALAVFQTLTNTAIAVTSALKIAPPLGIVLAGIVGALGAVQTAAVLATPLPGAEEGGYLDVTREQDRKKFRAKYDPNSRGYVDATSVIVSEDGSEYVATAAAVRNPTIRPVLDIIDIATRNGTVGTINLPAVMQSSIPGRAYGGYVKPVAANPNVTTWEQEKYSSEGDSKLFQKIYDALGSIEKRFSKPIISRATILGDGGVQQAINELKRIRKKL